MNEKNNAFPPKNHSIFLKEGGGWWGVKWFSGGTEGGIVRIQQNLIR